MEKVAADAFSLVYFETFSFEGREEGKQNSSCFFLSLEALTHTKKMLDLDRIQIRCQLHQHSTYNFYARRS
jgi:hypothetical protein